MGMEGGSELTMNAELMGHVALVLIVIIVAALVWSVTNEEECDADGSGSDTGDHGGGGRV